MYVWMQDLELSHSRYIKDTMLQEKRWRRSEGCGEGDGEEVREVGKE